MAIVKISNLPKPVAIALDWHALKGSTSERKEAAALGKREGVKFGCIFPDEEAGITIVGLSADNSEGADCGASWLANACGRSATILVEPLEDGRLWLCAVRAGLPVQGMDILIESASLHERLRDFQLQCPGSKIYSTLEHLGSAYEDVSEQSFSEIVANATALKIRRIYGVNPWISGSISLCLIALGTWYGITFFTAQDAMENARLKQTQASVDQQRRDAEAALRARQEYVASAEVLLKNVVLEQPSIENVVAAIFHEIETKPLNIAGWSLVQADCDAHECRLEWIRSPQSTLLRFLDAASIEGWETPKLIGNSASTQHQLQTEAKGFGVDKLDEAGPFLIALESAIQSIARVTYNISVPDPVEKALGVVAGSVQEPLPWKVGTISVTGSNLRELRELPSRVSHAGLSVKRMNYNFLTNTWTLEMNYATR